MKYLIRLLSTLAVIAFFCLPAQAQNISFGGGVGYGTHSERPNFQVNAYFRLPGTPIRIGGDVSYYLPDEEEFEDGESTLNVLEGNLNVHYLIVDTRAVGLYGLTGLNVNYYSTSSDFAGLNTSESETRLGWNIGAGAEVKAGPGRAFGEAKYVITENSQLVLGAGFRLTL